VGELVGNVIHAAADVGPRTFVDPRWTVRYATNLASRWLQLQGGLILRAVLVTPPSEDGTTDTERDAERVPSGV
jgi:hypothetical protein